MRQAVKCDTWRSNGYVRMPERWIRHGWIKAIDALVKRLRAEEDAHMINDAKERFKGGVE